MHESSFRMAAAKWMRKRWPECYFIEESYTPYGSDNLNDRRGYPDILRISPEGEISIVEVKKWGHQDFQKWKILGELQFYTFLIETQYKQDNEKYLWMLNLIKKGLQDDKIVDKIEKKFKKRKNIVADWVILIVGGEKDEIEQDDSLWHMHDYINLSYEENKWFRPLIYLQLIKKDNEFICQNLSSWFRRDEEDDAEEEVNGES